MLEYAVDRIESAIKKLQYQYRKDSYSTKGASNDYAIDFIAGLKEKFEQQKQENQECVLDEEVVEAFSQKKFDRFMNTSSKFQGHTDLYYKGVEDGEKFSVSDKIT